MRHLPCLSIALSISLLAVLVCGVAFDQRGGRGNGVGAAGSAYAAAIAAQRREAASREGGFHGVAIVDKKNLWAIGLEGDPLQGSEDSVILNSTDSGSSWTRNLLMTASYLHDIYFQNALTGWVVGTDQQKQGLILHTTDGGRNWTRQQVTAKRPLWRVTFISETRGWVTGWGGRVLRTSDGGAHWLSLRLPFVLLNDEITAELKDVSFADESNGWIVGEMGRVYESTDGGASWQSRTSQFSRLIKVRQPWRVNFKRVHFFSTNVGFMIVEVNDKRDPSAPPTSYLRKLVILRTENGGRDWRVRGTIETPQFVAAQFLTRDEWWVRNSSSTALLHTVDGGNTWSEVKLTRDARNGPVVFLDSSTGWVFSSQSGFWFPNLLTRDGGKTWTTQTIDYITPNSGTPRR